MSKEHEKILIVANPVSGDIDKEPIITKIKESIKAQQSIEVLKTTGQNDKEAIDNAIKKIGPNRIIAVGGDGTIKLIAEKIQNNQKIIGIIPAGSANGLATDIGLPKNPENAIEMALGDYYIEIDNLRINDQLCLHISDMGLNAELINQYSDQPMRGYLGYALSALPTLSIADKKYNFKVEMPDQTIRTEAIMVAFTNCKQFGNGVEINPDAKINDGKFEVLIFKEFNVVEVIKTLAGKISMNPDFVEIIRTETVKVTSDQPVPFQMDGEFCDKITNVKVSVLPANMKIAIGNL